MARQLVSYVHVFDDRGEPHAFGPGDEVPKWALEKMGDHCFVDDSDDEAAADYSKLKVDELKAEIDRRNEGRDEDEQIVPDGDKKADLVAALEADDQPEA